MPVNHLTFQGNLTRDPELRVLNSGTAVCNFSVAHNSKWKDAQGQEREEVCFLECAAWGKTGETIAKFFGKGGVILVEGSLKQEEWEDKETKAKRSKHKLNVERFHFCGKNGMEGQGGQSDGQRHENPPAENFRRPAPAPTGRQAPPPRPQENLDEDVPF